MTFARDISRILQAHCETCHRPGQIAPMSLRTYDEVRPWAKSIRQQVSTGSMPPFHAAGPLGKYADDPRLSPDEIASIVQWVESGAPLGDRRDLPAPKDWGNEEWPTGEPDLIVELPIYQIRDQEMDDYVKLFSRYEFPEDTWIRGFDMCSAIADAVHHANIFLTLPGQAIPSRLFDYMMLDLEVQPAIGQLLPGRGAELLGAGRAIKIPAGRRIILDTHFSPLARNRLEQILIGFYYADGEIRYEEKILGQILTDIHIEPGDPHFELHGEAAFPVNALVHAYDFHMHYRGSYARIDFAYPDGRRETAIEVPAYNFNWQRKYHLAQPITVPKGTQALLTLRWDNSANNKLNPDPGATVTWGDRTVDEMGFGTVYYTVPDEPFDPPIVVKNGRRVED